MNIHFNWDKLRLNALVTGGPVSPPKELENPFSELLFVEEQGNEDPVHCLSPAEFSAGEQLRCSFSGHPRFSRSSVSFSLLSYHVGHHISVFLCCVARSLYFYGFCLFIL